MKLLYIQNAILENRFKITIHAQQKMFDLGITLGDIEYSLTVGEVIETIPKAKPYPTTIVLGRLQQSGDEIHIVFSKAHDANFINLVTVYFPEEKYWEKAKIRRRK
jgi:hypothetical protein